MNTDQNFDTNTSQSGNKPSWPNTFYENYRLRWPTRPVTCYTVYRFASILGLSPLFCNPFQFSSLTIYNIKLRANLGITIQLSWNGKKCRYSNIIHFFQIKTHLLTSLLLFTPENLISVCFSFISVILLSSPLSEPWKWDMARLLDELSILTFRTSAMRSSAQIR